MRLRSARKNNFLVPNRPARPARRLRTTEPHRKVCRHVWGNQNRPRHFCNSSFLALKNDEKRWRTFLKRPITRFTIRWRRAIGAKTRQTLARNSLNRRAGVTNANSRMASVERFSAGSEMNNALNIIGHNRDADERLDEGSCVSGKVFNGTLFIQSGWIAFRRSVFERDPVSSQQRQY